MSFWFGAVAIPYLALFALAIAGGGRGRKETLAQFFKELGAEACLVGFGITGALFASHEVGVKLGAEAGEFAGGFLCLDLILCGLCFRLRDSEREEEICAVFCMILGAFSLGLNSFIVAKYS